MRKNGRIYIALTTTLLILSAGAKAQNKYNCKKQNRGTCTYDLSSGTVTGQIQRGPGRVRAINLNTIRYDYEFTSAATYQASPDIWSGLSAIATTNASQIATPAPAPPPPPAPALPKLIPKAVSAFQPVQKAIDSAEEQIKAATIIHNAFQARWDPIRTLNSYTTEMQTDQNNANAATAIVAQAGAALVNYLNFSTNSTDDLVRATKEQLAEKGTTDVDGVAYTFTSIFIAGTKASWPDSMAVVTLQNNLVKNAADLDSLNLALPTYAPNELATLKASETLVASAISELNAAYGTFTAHSKPIDDQESAFKNEMGRLNGILETLQADQKYLDQAPTLITSAINQNATDTTGVTALLPSASNYTAFLNARNALLQWKAKMSTTIQNWKGAKANPSTAKDPFSRESEYENCGFAFSSTKDTVVTLTRVDLTPGLANVSPQTVLTVKIECTSPFSLSAGVVFSTIPEHEFTISQIQTTSDGTTTTSNFITESSSSNFHPLPLALASMRFYEPNEKFAMALSFGVAANIRSQTAGGSTAEYLFGPSLEFFRSFFITPGIHFGSEASVGGGYSLNSTVPSTVTTAPISTRYKVGFGLGISFAKP